jgi:hypothetical protein
MPKGRRQPRTCGYQFYSRAGVHGGRKPEANLVLDNEERNRMPRELFLEAVVANKTAAAVVPRPENRLFFVHLFEDEIAYLRKRRDSNPRSQP